MDDGSTDDTRAVVEAIEDTRIKYYWKVNAERGAARNFGAERATGEYLNFFDSDDITLQFKRIKELQQLQQSEKNLDQQIADTKKELELLRTNPSTLEKYAREKYLMKKDNEDLYIIAKDGKITQ